MNALPTKNIVLANQMAERLELLHLKPTDYKWAVFVIDTLLGKMQRSKHASGHVEMPAEYIAKVFKDAGAKMLRTLVKVGIVTSPQSWSNGERVPSYCRVYEINPELLTFDETARLEVSVDPEQKDQDAMARRVFYMEDNLRQLEVNVTKALQLAHRLADRITLDKYEVGEEMTDEYLRVRIENKKLTWRCSRETALAKAQEWGLTLIRKRKKYGKRIALYVKDPIAHVARIRAVSRMSWTKAILQLEKKVVRAARNVTNQRLDSNITNLPTAILEHVKVDCGQQLQSIDLSNSQFAFLAAIVRNGRAFTDKRAAFFASYQLEATTEDFLRSAECGTLYEDICTAWGLDPIKERNVAKIALFACLFSRVKVVSKEKEMLRQAYPQVVQMIDDFKVKHGSKKFAVLLQLCEAEVFIDGISAELARANVWHLTKHDSVLCTPEDTELVTQVCAKHLTKYSVAGHLKAPLPAHA